LTAVQTSSKDTSILYVVKTGQTTTLPAPQRCAVSNQTWFVTRRLFHFITTSIYMNRSVTGFVIPRPKSPIKCLFTDSYFQ